MITDFLSIFSIEPPLIGENDIVPGLLVLINQNTTITSAENTKTKP
jgi:hypothetical protein